MEKSVKEKAQIKKLPTARKRVIEALPEKERDSIEGLIDAIEAAGIQEFVEYIRSPWKMLWPNFVAGVARGFGALVGVTIVIAIIGWTLSLLIDLPLIGSRMEPYIQKIQTEFSKYTEATNYRPNFERMESTLQSIDTSLKQR
jgi:Domain of unknown function (DUF5665)